MRTYEISLSGFSAVQSYVELQAENEADAIAKARALGEANRIDWDVRDNTVTSIEVRYCDEMREVPL